LEKCFNVYLLSQTRNKLAAETNFVYKMLDVRAISETIFENIVSARILSSLKEFDPIYFLWGVVSKEVNSRNCTGENFSFQQFDRHTLPIFGS